MGMDAVREVKVMVPSLASEIPVSTRSKLRS